MQKAVLETLQDDHPRRENLALLRKVSARPNGRCGHSWKGDERVYPKGNRQLLADDVKGLITLYKNEYRAVGATSRGLHLRDLHTHCVGVRWRSLTTQEWNEWQKTANGVSHVQAKDHRGHCHLVRRVNSKPVYYDVCDVVGMNFPGFLDFFREDYHAYELQEFWHTFPVIFSSKQTR